MLASRGLKTEEIRTPMDAATPMDAPPRAIERVRERVSAADLAAAGAFAVSLVVYVRTLLPGVSFGDWAEAEMIPSRLGILHPTGYPLYSLVGTLFSLIPVGSVAYRANLLSAVAAAGAVAVMVLIAVRLGVRPVVAFAAGLALAFTGTIWQEATFSEMNGLHVFIVALLLHRALVWREERRDRDLLLGALLGGLCVSNHGLAITVVPIVILFVLADARREIRARPMLLVKAGAVFALGLLPYLWLPLRALAGPAEAYGPFLTLEGLFAHISGAQFRGDMHFTSIESVQAAWAALPQVSDHLLATVEPRLRPPRLLRDRAPGPDGIDGSAPCSSLLGIVNVYFYANYLGNLSHYLLTSWLILGIGLGVCRRDPGGDRRRADGATAGVGRLRDADPAGGPDHVELGQPRPVGEP